MPRFETSIRVNAAPDTVFGAITDLANAPSRISGIKRVEILTEGPVGKGTKFRETRVMFGREATEEMEITEFTPGRGYVLECESCGCRYSSTMGVAPDGAGTRLSMSFNAVPLSVMAKVMGAIMMPFMSKGLKRTIDKDLAEIKAAIESG